MREGTRGCLRQRIFVAPFVRAPTHTPSVCHIASLHWRSGVGRRNLGIGRDWRLGGIEFQSSFEGIHSCRWR